MVFTSILFYFFSIGLVISCFIVIISKNSVFSIIFLAISFIFASLLLFLLECEFLALLFLVIYLGAILVLFLFAIMMLESKLINLFYNQIAISTGFIFGVLLFSYFITNINLNYIQLHNLNYLYFNIYQNWYNLIDCFKDIQVYGQILYLYYVLQFLILGLILMLMLISVVYLTNNYYKQQINDQSIFKQLSRNFLF